MSENLNKLYPDLIRSHAERPYHFEKHATPTFQAYNPLCGDKFDIFIPDLADHKLNVLYFFGFGCAISKASTSIMTKVLEGQSRADALKICEQFILFAEGKLQPQNPLPGEFEAFSALHEFPERLECAVLPWHEMKKFLESKEANWR